MHKAAPHLDGAYAAFGKIIEGMDIVNKIAETDTDYSDRPLDEQKMKKVTVDTMGTEYPNRKKHKKNIKKKRNSRIIATSNTYDAEENKRWK